MSLSRSRIAAFLLDCVSLNSPQARLTAIGLAVVALCSINLQTLGLPDLCLWKKLFGYCPAGGTTRALFAFFHGNLKEALHYNWNVVIIVPALAFFFISDTSRIIRRIIEKRQNPNAVIRTELSGAASNAEERLTAAKNPL
jgi:hypothetical protein